jgi:adenine phosphoribosyltransferase
VKEYLHLIDTHTSGARCDVTPLFANPVAFMQLVQDLSDPFVATPVDYVAGIDALGFILGTAVAMHLHKGFIPIRKEGKLPVDTVKREFTRLFREPQNIGTPKRADPGVCENIGD